MDCLSHGDLVRLVAACHEGHVRVVAPCLLSCLCHSVQRCRGLSCWARCMAIVSSSVLCSTQHGPCFAPYEAGTCKAWKAAQMPLTDSEC